MHSTIVILTCRILLMVVIAAALDLSLSLANGYAFRTNATVLIMLDGLFLTLLLVPTFVVLLMTNFVPQFRTLFVKAPWSLSILSATTPIAFVTLYRFHGVISLCVHTLVLLLIFILIYFEATRASKGARWFSYLLISVAALIIVKSLVIPPQPGRSMLRLETPNRAKPADADAPNLLLIVLDTMRSDHLEIYGYPKPTSPWLKDFGQKATVFNYAFSSSSYTLPAHATLFTGLHARAHGADIVDDSGGASLYELGRHDDLVKVAPLPPEALTLAEIASDAGLQTGAICANSAYLYRYFGLDQGFGTYVDARPVNESWRPAGLSIGSHLMKLTGYYHRYFLLLQSNERYYLLASEVNVLAKQWLESMRGHRFFLFLNYMDPHQPYSPIGKYKHLFPASDTSLVDAYDAEVRYLDDHLAELFAWLESWKLLDRTLVVIVGDHGESFGEHKKLGHAVTLYEPEIRIPLLIKLPGQQTAQRVNRFVHLVDILPTILELMGFDRPSNLQGGSLFGYERSYPLVSFLGKYLRDYEERAIYRDPWKLIQRSEGDVGYKRVELFNIREDPQENHNLATQNAGLVTEMIDELKRFQAEVQPRFHGIKKTEIDAETLKRLRSLGYTK